MSEFKFACPVCGQHITADSNAAGSQLECPTCFRKIVVPQAPSSAGRKFILSAAEADKPRLPTTAAAQPEAAPASRGMRDPFLIAMLGLLILACATVATFFVLRGKGFKPGGPVDPSLQKHGAIGVAAWNTRVEFTNIVVTQGRRTLYRSDFTSGSTGWQLQNGTWATVEGVLRQTTIAVDCRAVTGDASWGNYTLSLRARKLSGREGFIVMFNVVNAWNWTWWNLGGWENTRHAVENCEAGRKSTLDGFVAGRIETGRWYDVRVELNGPRVRCYLDNALIHDVAYPAPAPHPPSASGVSP